MSATIEADVAPTEVIAHDQDDIRFGFSNQYHCENKRCDKGRKISKSK